MDSEENIQQKIVKNAPEKAVVDVNERRRRGLTERLDEEARTSCAAQSVRVCLGAQPMITSCLFVARTCPSHSLEIIECARALEVAGVDAC
jgi:hypothetical protein